MSSWQPRWECRERYAPTGLAHRVDDGLPAPTCLYEARLEEVVRVNVVGNGAGKGENDGYHHGCHVDVGACPADDAKADEQS